eukprot:GHVR01121945.1.p1 GENE.GHVR01121945.1~~GHVR01121945.1.p1  ORF type:complete len:495 (-),score=129.36 GHVR01121945.1:591-2075(-)
MDTKRSGPFRSVKHVWALIEKHTRPELWGKVFVPSDPEATAEQLSIIAMVRRAWRAKVLRKDPVRAWRYKGESDGEEPKRAVSARTPLQELPVNIQVEIKQRLNQLMIGTYSQSERAKTFLTGVCAGKISMDSIPFIKELIRLNKRMESDSLNKHMDRQAHMYSSMLMKHSPRTVLKPIIPPLTHSFVDTPTHAQILAPVIYPCVPSSRIDTRTYRHRHRRTYIQKEQISRSQTVETRGEEEMSRHTHTLPHKHTGEQAIYSPQERKHTKHRNQLIPQISSQTSVEMNDSVAPVNTHSINVYESVDTIDSKTVFNTSLRNNSHRIGRIAKPTHTHVNGLLPVISTRGREIQTRLKQVKENCPSYDTHADTHTHSPIEESDVVPSTDEVQKLVSLVEEVPVKQNEAVTLSITDDYLGTEESAKTDIKKENYVQGEKKKENSKKKKTEEKNKNKKEEKQKNEKRKKTKIKKKTKKHTHTHTHTHTQRHTRTYGGRH